MIIRPLSFGLANMRWVADQRDETLAKKPFARLFVRLFVRLFARLFVTLFAKLFVTLFAKLFVRLFVGIFKIICQIIVGFCKTFTIQGD